MNEICADARLGVERQRGADRDGVERLRRQGVGEHRGWQNAEGGRLQSRRRRDEIIVASERALRTRIERQAEELRLIGRRGLDARRFRNSRWPPGRRRRRRSRPS